MWIGLADEAGRSWYGISSEVDIDWPNRLCDLNAAAVEAGVEVPLRAVNHLHLRVHAEWNRGLFKLIRSSLER